MTRWFNYRRTCSSFNGKIVSPFFPSFSNYFFLFLFYRARCQSFLGFTADTFQFSNSRGYKTKFLCTLYLQLIKIQLSSNQSNSLYNFQFWSKIQSRNAKSNHTCTKRKITRKKKKRKKHSSILSKKTPTRGKFAGRRAIRERNKVWRRRRRRSLGVSISMGWKSIGENVEAAVVTGGGTSLPLFHPVSRTLGTYRKWEGEGQGGRRGCSPLPITSSDIQANILPLPVTWSPLCLFPSRLEDTLPLFPRVTVCVRPSIPWGIFEGPARRKRMSSLLRAERKFLLAIFAHPFGGWKTR